jgi:hypothetical protein
MTFHKRNSAGAGRRAGRGLPIAAAVLLLPLGACNTDKLLRVDDPDVATPESVNDSTALPVVYNGVLGDFATAFAGNGNTGGGNANEGQILLSGLLGDEYNADDSFDTRIRIDQRDILENSNGTSTNGQLEDAFRNLQRARVSAENAAERFANVGHTTDPRRSEVLSLAGFAYLMFGENYCSGVTFSKFPLEGGAPIYGSPTARDDIFRLALARFDSALAITGGDATLRDLARVGRGRALVNLGDFAGAAAAVGVSGATPAVPTGFQYQVEYSDNSATQENGVYNYTLNYRRYGVADKEGGVGLPYRSADDPRVPWKDLGKPFDTTLPIDFYGQLAYTDRNAAVTLASGVEARLIEAEAALKANDVATFLGKLGAERTAQGAGGTPADPGSPATRLALLFQERGFSLWQTSHRLGDMRRELRQYGLTEAQVYPTGEYIRAGATFGHDLNLPIYIDETNNPNFTGCIDRNA